jgi:hypothetical protein
MKVDNCTFQRTITLVQWQILYICDLLDDIRKSLPDLEVYAKIFTSSDIQLLNAPLLNIYVHLILFGVRAITLWTTLST